MGTSLIPEDGHGSSSCLRAEGWMLELWKLRELPETGLSSWTSPMALQVQPWLRGDGLTHLEGEKPKGFQSKLVVTHTRNIFPQQTK